MQHALNLTPAGTKRLGAALELHRRMLRSRRPQTALGDPYAVAQVMLPLAGRDHECVWCLCLNSRCELIGEPIQISQGEGSAEWHLLGARPSDFGKETR